jgi:hypothetical protein
VADLLAALQKCHAELERDDASGDATVYSGTAALTELMLFLARFLHRVRHTALTACRTVGRTVPPSRRLVLRKAG